MSKYSQKINADDAKEVMVESKGKTRALSDIIETAYLHLGDLSVRRVHDYIVTPPEQFADNPIFEFLYYMSMPSYTYFCCKYLFNVNLLPIQVVTLQELYKHKFPMLVASRGYGKTFLLALYSLIRATFDQGTKVIYVGSGYRQSKLLFSAAESIYNKSPIFKHMVGCDRFQGPKHDIDQYTMYIGDSNMIAVPIGTGKSIRGLRSNITVCDEFASIPLEVYEIVVKGFSSVSSDPVDKVKRAAATEYLKARGIDIEQFAEILSLGMGNQTIIGGTSSYAFNHFYKYWRRYKDIIESHGDIRKLQEIFLGEVPEDFNYKDYAIIRVPFDSMPDAFMDTVQIAQSRALSHSTLYLMEYGCCTLPNTKVITNKGISNIQDIQVGDMVLTHKGRFRKVIKRTYREYDGEIRKIRTWGYNQPIYVTPDHPFWIDNDWVECKDVDKNLNLANLKELSGRTSIDLKEICTNYRLQNLNVVEYIFTKCPSKRLTDDEIEEIRKSPLSNKELSKKYGVIPSHIWRCKKPPITTKHKGCIPSVIPLDYNFGLIVGYYAAEGSCGAYGRLVDFSLDGHEESPLEYYIKQLSEAIEAVFGIKPKFYPSKEDNVIRVDILSRLVVELMKFICPGLAHTKIINPDVLYSNPDFLEGFIVGFWNGDGHISSWQSTTQARVVNENLIAQLKIAISYFGIGSSFLKFRHKKTTFIKGRTYNLRQLYGLNISGTNANRFKDLFYDMIPYKGTDIRLQRISSDDEKTIYKLRANKKERYGGLVFNLEVEEDNSYSLLNTTVHNCWAIDSDGWFKRSTIEKATCKHPILLPSGPVQFEAATQGHKDCKYVYGIDPASENDNFAIIVLEVHPDHRRIVYCWTVTRKKMQERLKNNTVEDKSFYNYCARKIRDLMRVFPTQHIGMDAQGGGRTGIAEALHDTTQLEQGEKLIWQYVKEGDQDPYFWEEKGKPTDGQAGEHILHLVEFANAKFTSEANHGLKRDLETKTLLFPRFDAASIGLAFEADKIAGREYDTLEDVVIEIEELKDELATVEHTQTANGRDRWDTPDTVKVGFKKARMRKDRYSALCIANMIARVAENALEPTQYNVVGGYVGQKKSDVGGALYVGPQYITQKIGSFYGMGVHR